MAIAYGREAKTLPFYQERAGNGKTAYNLAIADWCHAPVIHSIERHEGRIRVEASDNIKVTKIEVRILDNEGNVLEASQAEQVNPLYWEYAYSAKGPVEASAWDPAGNRTVMVWQKSAKTS